MTAKDGGPLRVGEWFMDGQSELPPLSLRDYFAAQALMSLPVSEAEYELLKSGVIGTAKRTMIAYLIADGMLAERVK